MSASVTLARGCDTYTGHGESANTPFARRRCVSEAALAAVNRAAGETCFELASVDAVTLAGQGIVVTQVYSLRDGQRLLGSAFLNEDPTMLRGTQRIERGKPQAFCSARTAG